MTLCIQYIKRAHDTPELFPRLLYGFPLCPFPGRLEIRFITFLLEITGNKILIELDCLIRLPDLPIFVKFSQVLQVFFLLFGTYTACHRPV